MKKTLVILILSWVLGIEGNAQFYNPFCNLPSGCAFYPLYDYTFLRYRYAGSEYLPQQSTGLPLGWNRYYLASRQLGPYSLIIRNAPVYSSYQDSESAKPSSSARPPVTVHAVPLREILPAPARSGSAEIAAGMTEEQVKSQLGLPMLQVTLGGRRSYVYDVFRVEFENGRVTNVVFK
ncbi:MAG: hypothetical protein HY644_07260 [Acidobacteria bacterium]|nr:hypothetical protein [Acidobacteriota bacterium]